LLIEKRLKNKKVPVKETKNIFLKTIKLGERLQEFEFEGIS